MAKRYTDSGKWDDPFFADLSNEYKLLWIFILDKCNHAGIYKLNPKMAEFCLGAKFDWKEVLGVFKGRIQSLNDEKWFIPKFIEYQYGVLCDNNRVHNSIIQILNKEGVRTVLGSKDKEKEKDKVKDKEKDKYIDYVYLSKIEYQYLIDKFGKQNVDEYIENLNDYIGSKGKQYKSHYHTLRNWLRRDNKRPPPNSVTKPEPTMPNPSPDDLKSINKMVKDVADKCKA